MIFVIIFFAVLFGGLILFVVTSVRDGAKNLPPAEGIASPELVDELKRRDDPSPRLEFFELARCQEVVKDRYLREALLTKEKMSEFIGAPFNWGVSNGRYAIWFEAAAQSRQRFETSDQAEARRVVRGFMLEAPRTPRSSIPFAAPGDDGKDALLKPNFASAYSEFFRGFGSDLKHHQCTNHIVMAANASRPYVTIQSMDPKTGFEAYHLLARIQNNGFVYLHAHNGPKLASSAREPESTELAASQGPDGRPSLTPNASLIAELVRLIDTTEREATALAQRARESKLEFKEAKIGGNARFVVFRGADPEVAKSFLKDTVVDERALQYIVETEDGVWGTDIEGLYLENLRPWQRDVPADAVRGTVATIFNGGNSLSGAARGLADNYLAGLRCGSCGEEWTDGVRYVNITAVRCPSCRTLNAIDTSGFTWTAVHSAEPPPDPVARQDHVAPLTPTELSSPREVATQLADLVSQLQSRDRTAEQGDLCLDIDHLDGLLARSATPEEWIAPFVGIRAIGHQLDLVGGLQLQEKVFDRLTVHGPAAESIVSTLWNRIGRWVG